MWPLEPSLDLARLKKMSYAIKAWSTHRSHASHQKPFAITSPGGSMSVYESDLSRLVDELNRSMPATKTDTRPSIDDLLGLAAEQNASDVILVAGAPITLPVNGSLAPAAGNE